MGKRQTAARPPNRPAGAGEPDSRVPGGTPARLVPPTASFLNVRGQMQAVLQSGTGPELALRSRLRMMGFRFRVSTAPSLSKAIRAQGWALVLLWEHEPPETAAALLAALLRGCLPVPTLRRGAARAAKDRGHAHG